MDPIIKDEVSFILEVLNMNNSLLPSRLYIVINNEFDRLKTEYSSDDIRLIKIGIYNHYISK